MLPDQEKYAISIPLVSSIDSADSSGASVSSELEEVSAFEGVWEDGWEEAEAGSEEVAAGSEAPPSLEGVPPLHAARENTSVMDNKSDNIFSCQPFLSLFMKEQLFHCSARLMI
ncbi:MAG TPA: hypothetical protein IAB66_00270 [Candidatus Caccousia avistercoris]|nr:hypothetical protein [Candidatus Caccousia avistercoris]